MSEPNRGAALAREYLTETGQKQADLARAADVSDVTALNWLRSAIKPLPARRRLIARWSIGRVPPEAWDEPATPAVEADPMDPALDEGRPSLVA